ncbi:ABC transporter substrate-binding protein [Anaeromyxobacter sp. PSR-1]|uniref:ABC transporter substrate-binding protein n=1 Tax=Anaeromyxobacter sp. PSR-1 TaxID=1300915 RepID=UPI0005E8927A|nr:helical backbone metal receptor [Anaeromyxobacter sp. PSR-1]GAO01522.1 cobalamin-binding protein [Anaeromyxobacter sp. PSR-1]
MKVTSPVLGNTLTLDGPARRVVSLVSSATETLFAVGAGAAVVGVSPYCARYVPGLAAPVVGDYVRADPAAIRAAAPDLVVVTDGVQLPLARRLAAEGLPAYLLPVPQSRFGILENAVALGALTGRLAEARALCASIEAGAAALVASAPAPRPRVYAELWFGAHPRRFGGRAFVHDVLELAGAENLFGEDPFAYAPLDLGEVERRAPEWLVVFQEPEHPVDARALAAARGWAGRLGDRIVTSTVERGRNLIHDGPSFLETARWLRGVLLGEATR